MAWVTSRRLGLLVTSGPYAVTVRTTLTFLSYNLYLVWMCASLTHGAVIMTSISSKSALHGPVQMTSL